LCSASIKPPTDSKPGPAEAAHRPEPPWPPRASGPGRPGRQIRPVGPGKLIGIIGDVIGLQRFELGCQARWWATLRLAAAARATRDVIAAHEPYANHRHLKQVHAAAAAVQQLGATTPPDPAGLAGLDIRLPHPAGHRAAPAGVGAAEELTRIAALLRPTPDGCQPRLTVRQIQSVLHARAGRGRPCAAAARRARQCAVASDSVSMDRGTARAGTVHRRSHTRNHSTRPAAHRQQPPLRTASQSTHRADIGLG